MPRDRHTEEKDANRLAQYPPLYTRINRLGHRLGRPSQNYLRLPRQAQPQQVLLLVASYRDCLSFLSPPILKSRVLTTRTPREASAGVGIAEGLNQRHLRGMSVCQR
jgi:hypothetical protein